MSSDIDILFYYFFWEFYLLFVELLGWRLDADGSTSSVHIGVQVFPVFGGIQTHTCGWKQVLNLLVNWS